MASQCNDAFKFLSESSQ